MGLEAFTYVSGGYQMHLCSRKKRHAFQVDLRTRHVGLWIPVNSVSVCVQSYNHFVHTYIEVHICVLLCFIQLCIHYKMSIYSLMYNCACSPFLFVLAYLLAFLHLLVLACSAASACLICVLSLTWYQQLYDVCLLIYFSLCPLSLVG